VQESNTEPRVSFEGQEFSSHLISFSICQCCDFFVAPNVVGNASGHRRGNPERFVDTGEVVMDEV
jgi:hypothetical protein